MRVIGIITEFNPLHQGHEYLINEARRLVNDPRAFVMTAMSGPFVQRGLPAVTSKHVRTGMALKSGADAVIEIPFTFACAPSERFAFGAVELLYRTGVVTDLAFGIDCENPELITELARLTPDDEVVRACLKSGKSYPAARAEGMSAAYLHLHPDSDENTLSAVRDTLHQPNSILALDYIRAVKALNTGFRIHMIPRKPGMSATATREKLFSANTASVSSVADTLIGSIPDAPLSVWLSALSAGELSIPDNDRYVRSLVSLVRRGEDMSRYAYMTDGLDGYIRNTFCDIRDDYSFTNISSALSTKHFTMPRIWRALASLSTGQTAEYVDSEKHVQYIRILGFSKEGRYCLKIMGKCARLPLIHNCSDALELYSERPRLKSAFELDLNACRLHAEYLGMNPDYEWNRPPIMNK